jgi:hypothetical protein
MTALATFPKLDKLIPLLSSDKDGEVIATVGAIDRTLKSAGYDWFDLVKVIEIGGKQLTRPDRYVERVDAPITELDMARFALGNIGNLSESEGEFVRSVIRLLAYGNVLSPKQSRWLMAIYLALGGRP